MTMLRYTGDKLNKHAYRGPVTGTQYRFSAHQNSNTKQVDSMDAVALAQRNDFVIVAPQTFSPEAEARHQSPSSRVLDPKDFTIKTLEAALVGISIDDLNLIRDKEITGLDRTGALDKIHTAIVTAGGV